MQNSLNNKTINNAISAYLMIFISALFFLNKTNENINNSFVKNHTKSAILIHFLILINYLIFITFGLFSNIEIFGIGLNNIIGNIFFIILFLLLIIGIYKAKESKEFNIINIIKNKDKKEFIEINENKNIGEKDIVTIILSHIPIIGFYIFPNYKDNKYIKNVNRLSLLFGIIFLLLLIFKHENIANLLLLIYIIYVIFVAINLLASKNIININFSPVFSPSYKIIYQKALIEYIKKYFKGDFENFDKILNKKILETEKKDKETSLEIKKLNNTKIPKSLIYLPIINLFTIFNRNNNYKIHIQNGLIISLLFIINLLFVIFTDLNSLTLLLYLFPISYGLGFLNNNILNYRLAYINEIYIGINKILNFVGLGAKEINKKRKEVNEIKLEVKK